MKHDKNTLEQAMNYAEMMEACAAYVAVKKPAIKEPAAAFKLMAPLYRDAKQESFYVILLDTKNRVLGTPSEITRGLLDSCPVHPREVFRQAIGASAAAIILIHNHPSGDPTPSREDIDVTRRLVEVSRVIGIPVFDHIIIGTRNAFEAGDYVSLRERDLVSFSSSLTPNS